MISVLYIIFPAIATLPSALAQCSNLPCSTAIQQSGNTCTVTTDKACLCAAPSSFNTIEQCVPQLCSGEAASSGLQALNATCPQGNGTSAINPAVIGGAVGGAVALGAAAVAAYFAHHLAFLFSALLFSLFGIFMFKARRLEVKVDEHLPACQITLLLSRHEKWEDSAHENETPLVWKVFDIGGGNRDFEVLIPSERTGSQALGYGTVEDNEGQIKCLLVGKSPAVYSDEDGFPSWNEDNQLEKPERHALACTTSDIAMKVALGTFHSVEDGEKDPLFEPFLLINSLTKDNNHTHSSDLYLHIFRSNAFQPGQYRDGMGKLLKADSLLPNEKGLPVANLGPLTTWYIKPLEKGNLKVEAEAKEFKMQMEQGSNSAKDIKRYQHEFKLSGNKKSMKSKGNNAAV